MEKFDWVSNGIEVNWIFFEIIHRRVFFFFEELHRRVLGRGDDKINEWVNCYRGGGEFQLKKKCCPVIGHRHLWPGFTVNLLWFVYNCWDRIQRPTIVEAGSILKSHWLRQRLFRLQRKLLIWTLVLSANGKCTWQHSFLAIPVVWFSLPWDM